MKTAKRHYHKRRMRRSRKATATVTIKLPPAPPPPKSDPAPVREGRQPARLKLDAGLIKKLVRKISGAVAKRLKSIKPGKPGKPGPRSGAKPLKLKLPKGFRMIVSICKMVKKSYKAAKNQEKLLKKMERILHKHNKKPSAQLVNTLAEIAASAEKANINTQELITRTAPQVHPDEAKTLRTSVTMVNEINTDKPRRGRKPKIDLNMYDEVNLTALSCAIHDMNKRKGFWPADRKPAEAIALIHSELSEALECVREGYEMDAIYNDYVDKDMKALVSPKLEGVPIELADAMIRILDLCGRYDIDIHHAIKTKLDYNSTRPYRHGKLF